MKLKLSEILKYAGIGIGALGGLKIIFAELALILEHPIALIIMGIGAVTYFVGVWEAKHEEAVVVAKTTVVVPAVTVPETAIVPPPTTGA